MGGREVRREGVREGGDLKVYQYFIKMYDNIATWRLFWAAVTFFQGFIAIVSDIGDGYGNTTIAQGILIIYIAIVSFLGTYQYFTNYFYFLKSDYFDSHLIGNLVLSTWLLGLFEVGWIIGLGCSVLVILGIIYRLLSPDDPYREFNTEGIL